MFTITYTDAEMYALLLPMFKPTRNIRKIISFRLSLCNPDHPRPIPVLSSTRTQNSKSSYLQPNIVRSRQLLEIKPIHQQRPHQLDVSHATFRV